MVAAAVVARLLAWYWRASIPVVGGLMVGPLIYFFARDARGHGVPEVMKAVAVRGGGVIRARVVAVKAVASALSIGTGGSVGREGPIVQIGSAAGSAIGQWFKLNAAGVRTLVACGAAAGISATFNAPIAGAIFSAELIVGDFAVIRFTPIVIIPALMTACVISTLVTQLLYRDSIYTTKLRRQGIELFETRDPNVLKGLFVRDAIVRDPVVVPASANFKTVLDLVVQSAHSQLYVADTKGRYLGAISLLELRRLIYEQDALGVQPPPSIALG